MRFFELLQLQHVSALIILAIVFLVLFGIGLAYVPTIKPDEDKDSDSHLQRFADGITKANGPYPLIVSLIIAGTFLWAFLYTLFYGISKVRL